MESKGPRDFFVAHVIFIYRPEDGPNGRAMGCGMDVSYDIRVGGW